MFKRILILILSVFLLFSCSKKNNTEIISEPSEEDQAVSIYREAVEALKEGDAFFAATDPISLGFLISIRWRFLVYS